MKHLQQKWDESDFALQQEDMSVKSKPWQVEAGRVFNDPKRRRVVPTGVTTKSYVICYHGRFMAEACGLCEFEAPRLAPRRP